MSKSQHHKEILMVAGVDEAGRGPLAGPVFAAAVILNPKKNIRGLADSKILTAKRREQLEKKIYSDALSWAVGRAEVHEIDNLNILQASLLAMERAVAALTLIPELVLIDGNQYPKLSLQMKTVINGDATIPAISAASILAKVARDREMILLSEQYPDYGFAEHKGYATKRHLTALNALGPSPIHRRSFAPVQKFFVQTSLFE